MIIAIILLSFLLALAATAGGLIMSPDSVHYLTAAGNLASSGRLVAFDARPFVFWPPLYPALLAALSELTGLAIYPLARYANAWAMPLIVAAAYTLAKWDRALALWAAAVTALSIPLLAVIAFAWTEPLFCLFVALFLLAARGRRLPAMAILAALTMMTRYTGIVLLPAGWWALRKDRRQMALFTLSALPLALWLARNYAIAGALTGARPLSETGLLENLYLAAVYLSSWFIGRWYLALPLAAILLMLARPKLAPRDAPAALFAALYLVMLIASSTIWRYDAISHRLLTPLFIPLVALIVSVMAQLPVRRPALLLLLAAWLIAPLRVLLSWLTI